MRQTRETRHTACHGCGLEQGVPPLPIGGVARCARCAARLAERRPADAQRAAALALTALILLVPANLLPILELQYLGRVSSSTIWSGCVALWNEGMWLVAGIVFLVSIIVPFAKLWAVFVLAWLDGSGRQVALRAKLLRTIEFVGRWSMLDVFLLAILVALIKLGSMSKATPGPGLFFFAAVVVLTMFASSSFHPSALWRELRVEARTDRNR
jgi:paraquat-inducible protein A